MEGLDCGEAIFDRSLLLLGTGLGSDVPSLAAEAAQPLARIPLGRLLRVLQAVQGLLRRLVHGGAPDLELAADGTERGAEIIAMAVTKEDGG